MPRLGAPFSPFLGEEGSPTKIDYGKSRGTLIPTSLLEDLLCLKNMYPNWNPGKGNLDYLESGGPAVDVRNPFRTTYETLAYDSIPL